MKLNSKVTGGLAWAGLIVVLAVPSADMLTKPTANTATIASGMDAVQTASVAPAVKPVVPAIRKSATTVVAPAETAATTPATTVAEPTETAAIDSGTPDVVEDYISKGKKLPSYISDAPGVAAQEPVTSKPVMAKPATAKPAPAKPLIVPTTTASTPAVNTDGTFAGDSKADVAVVAPKPYPASMRPKTPTTAIAALPSNEEAPLIIDENELTQREAAIRPPVDMPEPQIVTEDELQEWDSGSLADYLERKGLISKVEQALDAEYDEDGFFLSDGPNKSSAKRRRVREEVDFFLF